MKRLLLCMLLALGLGGQRVWGDGSLPFAIHVVDDATGRGVPLVTLKTTNSIRHITDSNGWVAFDEPGLLGGRVYFEVSSPGYEYKADGLGFHGIALNTKAGGEATIKVHRVQIAERLYRITGQGIYADTIRLGKKAPTEHPLLNGRVMGQDSASTAIYKGKIYWFWGDTGRPAYPLGNFHMTGATSRLPGDGGLDPSAGVNLDYFTSDKGFVRPMFKLKKPGLVWSGCPMVLDLPEGIRMICQYTRLKDMAHVLGKGLAVWNDEIGQFEPRVAIPLEARLSPQGLNPFRHTEGGIDYFYFPSPYPLVRVRADWADVSNPAAYEAFTPLAPGTDFDGAKSRVERDAAGKIVYAWKRNTGYVDETRQQVLIQAGLMKAKEAWIDLRDVKTGRAIRLHNGTVRWNPYRNQWILIATEFHLPEGLTVQDTVDPQKVATAMTAQKVDSVLGDVWYGEADSPQGPWRKAMRIAVHPHYSFYHPVQHEFFDQEGGRLVYFEGTYTATFSGNDHPTPRYDYNQIMYRLDLADPRLKLEE